LKPAKSKQPTPQTLANSTTGFAVYIELRNQHTPQALANFSPGIAKEKRAQTLKGFANCRTPSGLVLKCSGCNPGFSLRSNPGLELANAFGVNWTMPMVTFA